MRRLWLLRHAKADPATSGGTDHDRCLSSKGRRQADRLAAYLAGEGIRPDLVLCSSARRARDTLAPVRDRLPGETRIEVERGLYLAGCEALLERIARIGDEDAEVFLVGHNPGLGDLARALARSGDAASRSQLRARFPTATLAVLGFDAEGWRQATSAGGRLLTLLRPRDLP